MQHATNVVLYDESGDAVTISSNQDADNPGAVVIEIDGSNVILPAQAVAEAMAFVIRCENPDALGRTFNPIANLFNAFDVRPPA